jgi:hypothetical protein
MKNNQVIKGLFIYALYTADVGLKLFLVMALMGGSLIIIEGVVNGISHMLPYVALIPTSLFPSVLVLYESKDIYTKWNRYQLAMPAKRSDVVVSKYLSYLLLLAAGITLTGIFTGLGFALLEVCDCFYTLAPRIFAISIGTSLTTFGLFYLITCKINADTEGVLLGCLFFSRRGNQYADYIHSSYKFTSNYRHIGDWCFYTGGFFRCFLFYNQTGIR